MRRLQQTPEKSHTTFFSEMWWKPSYRGGKVLRIGVNYASDS